MTQEREPYDLTMSKALKRSGPGDIPAAADIWPKVRMRLERNALTMEGRRSWPPFRMMVKVAAGLVAALLLVVGSLAVAAAASPGVRDVLHRAAEQVGLLPPVSSGVSVTGSGGFHDLQPVPPFRVFYLPTVPSQTPAEQVGQILPSTSGPGGVVAPLGFLTCSPTNTACRHAFEFLHLPCDVACQYYRRPFPQFRYPPDVESEYERGIATVWCWYSAVPRGADYLHIVEHPATVVDTPPHGGTVTIGGIPATLQQSGANTAIAFVRSGTSVTLTTNLGRAAAMNAAESLIKG